MGKKTDDLVDPQARIDRAIETLDREALNNSEIVGRAPVPAPLEKRSTLPQRRSRAHDNNPRGPFSQAVSLRVWRSPYDGHGKTQLFVEVQFREGRIGGENDSPIRFRLRFRQAEVHIRPDAARILKIVDSSIDRPAPIQGAKKTSLKQTAKGSASAALKATAQGLDTTLNLEAGGSIDMERVVEFTQTIGQMAVQGWPTDEGGYAYVLTPDLNTKVLKDAPWTVTHPRMSLRDPYHPRKGEPPEPMVQIVCAIEDLVIEDVVYKTRKPNFFERMPKNKRTAVIQYIRQQLREEGIDFGQATDPFARITLADAVAHEDQDAGEE